MLVIDFQGLTLHCFKTINDVGYAAQCVAGCGFRLFEVRFQARFAVLVPLKCGFMCGLKFLSVSGSRFSSNFDAACGLRRKILFLVKNSKYFFDKGI